MAGVDDTSLIMECEDMGGTVPYCSRPHSVLESAIKQEQYVKVIKVAPLDDDSHHGNQDDVSSCKVMGSNKTPVIKEEPDLSADKEIQINDTEHCYSKKEAPATTLALRPRKKITQKKSKRHSPKKRKKTTSGDDPMSRSGDEPSSRLSGDEPRSKSPEEEPMSSLAKTPAYSRPQTKITPNKSKRHSPRKRKKLSSGDEPRSKSSGEEPKSRKRRKPAKKSPSPRSSISPQRSSSSPQRSSSTPRMSYSVDFKLKVVASFHECQNARATGRDYGLSDKQVRDWVKSAKNLQQQPKTATKIKGSGRKVRNLQLERAMVEWVEAQRSEGLPVSGLELREKAREEAAAMGMEDFMASAGWLKRFKHRIGLSTRPNTSLALRQPSTMNKKVPLTPDKASEEV